MRISCPKCSATYQLDPQKLGTKPRQIKCTKCAETWRVNMDGSVSDEIQHRPAYRPSEKIVQLQAVKKELEKNLDQTKKKEKSKQDVARRFELKQWAIVASVMISICLGLVFGRTQIVDFWQPAGKLYDLVNLSVPSLGQGFVFTEVSANRVKDNEELVLVLKGKIKNETDQILKLPPYIQAVTLSVDKQPLEKWVFPITVTEVPPQGEVEFQNVLQKANGYAADISLRFLKKVS